MFVKHVNLTNFRNYEKANAALCPTRNILIGENAQGKTNFLEAIELFSNGYSDRANRDTELILNGKEATLLEIAFEAHGRSETASIALKRKAGNATKDEGGVERAVKVNGVSHGLMRYLRGHLASVSFKSQDLNLIRGGPKFRREWLDRLLVTLKPSLDEELNKYQKVISQRNRLLKMLSERGSVSTAKREELMVWDEQAAQYGSNIVIRRLALLQEILPKAIDYQRSLSQNKEELSLFYELKVPNKSDGEDDEDVSANRFELFVYGKATPLPERNQIANTLLRAYRDNRFMEIARKQTLCGPHRDDVSFMLNGKESSTYASQGQQRSLVLSLKLAELQHLNEYLNEPPILILDDVLAELDLARQSLLLSLVKNDMQTIISTTHLAGFEPEWLEGALILTVAHGSILAEPTPVPPPLLSQID
jgi:DNA replication and repair protein RecF